MPPGTARVFAAYNITGVEDMIKRIAILAAPPSVASDLDASPSTTASASATPKPLPLTFVGSPKVHVTFDLDTSGVVRAVRAEGTAEEEYTPTATPKPRQTATPVPAKISNETTANTSDAVGNNATNSSDPVTASASAAATSKNSTPAPSDGVDDALPPPKTALRTLRFALTVTLAPADETVAGSTVAHFGPTERASSGSTLAALAARDEAKRAVERAKSTLEAFIYSSRDRFEAAAADETSDITAVSTDEQREAVGSSLSDAESWLYDDGATADVAAYEDKLASVQALVNPILRRATEFGRRPQVINETRALITGMRKAITAWNKTHPQVSHVRAVVLLYVHAVVWQSLMGPGSYVLDPVTLALYCVGGRSRASCIFDTLRLVVTARAPAL